MVFRQRMATSSRSVRPQNESTGVSGGLVGGGGRPRFVAGASMDTGVPGHELVNPFGHHRHGRGGGRAIQVAVGPRRAVEARDLQVLPDQAGQRAGLSPVPSAFACVAALAAIISAYGSWGRVNVADVEPTERDYGAALAEAERMLDGVDAALARPRRRHLRDLRVVWRPDRRRATGVHTAHPHL